MSVYYHDSSALIKHYHAEVGTPVVDNILAEPGAIHFISRLSGVEVPSAFAKKVRTLEIGVADFQKPTVSRGTFVGSAFPDGRTPD
jgi:uncharacterized protein